jgi:imidazolonepropionase-like amidohydrolase
MVSMAQGDGSGSRIPPQRARPVPTRPHSPFTDSNEAEIVARGSFTLHKFEQSIGEETWEMHRSDHGVTVQANFHFKDRGQPVPLKATFRGAADLTPRSFEVDGKTCRQSEIHQAVEVRSDDVRIGHRGVWTEAARPKRFFTIAGYAPITLQMLLLRYWATHGSPTELTTLPTGSVRITHRGQDTFPALAKSGTLDRYSIEGLIWGRETAWLDASGTLVAVVTIDAEFDHFEAVADGYEGALGEFVRRAGADGMDSLAELATRISGTRSDLLAIVHGTLIDGTGAPAVPDSVVITRGDRILAAGPPSQVVIPSAATVLDAHGKSLLPGLWDMHAHFEQVEWGPIYLAAGVTTVRDCANDLNFITSVRDAVAEGRGLGPRILAAGVVDGSGPMAIGVARVDTIDEAETWVSRYRAAGFQQIKIYSSMKLEALRAVADAAHRAGMTVTGHVPEGLNAYQVIEAGQDQINHIFFLANIMHAPLSADASRMERLNALANMNLDSPEAHKAIAFLKAHRTVVDPTLALLELSTISTKKPPIAFEPGAEKLPPELSRRLENLAPPSPETELIERVFRRCVALVGALHRAGVVIVAGTDQAVPGHSLHREIELYVEAGLTPMQAIQAATIVPARVMQLDGEYGTIEAGKRADLILVNGNPLEQIHDIRKVSHVLVGGRMFDCAELWRCVGFRP